MGEFDPASATGDVAFVGGVRFTGHNGALDTTISEPVIVFTGPGAAQVRADVTGAEYSGGVVGESESFIDIALMDIDLSGASITEDADTVTLAVTDAPTVITVEGEPAFSSFYPAGTAFDPISFTVVAECAVAETAMPEPVESATPEVTAEAEVTAEDDGADLGWLPWTIGGAVVIAAIGVIVGVAARRRGAGGSTPGGSTPGGGDGTDAV